MNNKKPIGHIAHLGKNSQNIVTFMESSTKLMDIVEE